MKSLFAFSFLFLIIESTNAQDTIVCTNLDMINAIEIEGGSKSDHYEDSLSFEDSTIGDDNDKLLLEKHKKQRKEGTIRLNKQQLPKEDKGWNCLFAQYNAITILSNEKEIDHYSTNGFSLGYSRVFGLMSEDKIYTELGIAYQKVSDNRITQIDDNSLHEELEWEALKIFSNIIVRNKIRNSSIYICPYIGFQLRRNLSVDLEQTYKSKTTKVNGLKEGKWKKSYFDLHIGIHANVGRFLQISTQYGFDINSSKEYGRTRGWTIQVSFLL